ncbi:protein FAM200A-like [Linepithema humile]|uniref:protein FAM200A-like n=1 Tax=Linepithema humile TaxID=83485 RepID=UPI00351F0E8E
MAKAFNNEKMVEQFKSVRLSRQSVSRRVSVLSSNNKEKLRIMINNCRYFSLCLDESTDISDISQLLIYVRTVQDDFTTNEELLALKPLHDTTKGVDIYAAFMAAVNDYGTNLLKKCSCIVTDGAPAMTGKVNGFVGLLKENGINCPTLHCIVHQEALCGKFL